jgi:hypothetical protein
MYCFEAYPFLINFEIKIIKLGTCYNINEKRSNLWNRVRKCVINEKKYIELVF